MGGSPHSASGLENASNAAASGADRPVGLVAEQCAAVGWVYAHYDDKWQSPLTLLPMTVRDINGGVIAEGGRTIGLPTHGMEDGQPIQSVRHELGTQTYHAPQEGRVLVEIGPDPGGADPAALEAQIIADLQAFAGDMETAIQPWVQQWEDEGWWGLIGSFFEKTGEGLSAWWEGEGEFWDTVWSWLENLPDLAADAFDGAVAGVKELWDRRTEILSLIQYLAEGSIDAFEDGLELLLELFAAIPGLEEIVGLLRAVIRDSAEWTSAMIEMALKTQVLTVLAGTLIGTIMMIPPNFWTDIVGLASGYLIPEVFLAIILALIAFFSAGTLGGGLVLRLGAFVTKVTSKLAAAGRAGVVLLKIFDFLSSLTSKIVDLIKALRRRISETANGATGEATPVIRQSRPNGNPATRLPRTNGRWEGEPGNGTWYPDNPDAQSVIGDQGVEFRNGRPDFSPWSRGEVEFEPGVLDGSDTDFTRVYEQLKVDRGLSSNNAARELLSNAGLTPHHHSDTVIQLIPTDLHKNIPHIGSASDLRNNF